MHKISKSMLSSMDATMQITKVTRAFYLLEFDRRPQRSIETFNAKVTTI